MSYNLCDSEVTVRGENILPFSFDRPLALVLVVILFFEPKVFWL
jgi:hypothetical protein